MSKTRKILYLICSMVIGFGVVFLGWKYFSNLGPTKKEQVEERLIIVEEINNNSVKATVEERVGIIKEINSLDK